jgi:glyoxylase-like metal-dependent hydrolase (beta-lactamase superfamily II)
VRGVVVGLFRENCWIIGSRKRGEACVVAPGDEPEEILKLARDMGVSITRIVASHAHLDHIMAARAIVEATGAPFLMHALDLPIAAGMPDAALRWSDRAPAPEVTAYPRRRRSTRGGRGHAQHTPGHMMAACACTPLMPTAFSGDTLFSESIGRTDLPGGSTEQILESIATRLFVLPDDTRVLPGHMQETTIGHERAHNPFVG